MADTYTDANGNLVRKVGNVIETITPGPAYQAQLDAVAAAAQAERDAIATLLQQVKPACTAVIKHARGTAAAPTQLQVSRAIAGIIGYLKLTRELSDET